ncbi:hypothetical protein F5B21DRAFT_488258 [Xylaria acuta]|nr:hypothetical protein F5B21DRAFT_488258 [Xylaria acuta]
MASESSSPRTPTRESYINTPFSISHNGQYYLEDGGLSDLLYAAMLGEHGNYVQQYATGGLPQPMTPGYSGSAGPNNPWLSLDPALVHGSYPDAVPENLCTTTLDHSSYVCDLGGLFDDDPVFEHSYGTPTTSVGFAYNTPCGSWPSQATAASPTSSSQLSSPLSSPRVLSKATDTKLLPCPDCSACFKQKKDLNRHKNCVHATGDEPVYCCRCGKDNVRKDNHLRHVNHCTREHCHPYYTCKCGHACEDKESHVKHVSNCRHGFGRIGRPPAV